MLTAVTMTYSNAVNTLRGLGITTIAAAGNDGSTTEMVSPACVSGVISVGNSDNTDNPADLNEQQ